MGRGGENNVDIRKDLGISWDVINHVYAQDDSRTLCMWSVCRQTVSRTAGCTEECMGRDQWADKGSAGSKCQRRLQNLGSLCGGSRSTGEGPGEVEE